MISVYHETKVGTTDWVPIQCLIGASPTFDTGFPMFTQAEFIAQVRDALDHLYDYVYLQDHPLARLYMPEAEREGPNRAQRLHRLLLETIEELHPPSASSQSSSRARYYHLLVYRYVEGWQPAEIMHELACSRRQFFREQRKALTMLATLLWEKLPQRTSPSGEPGDLLTAEAERILAQREAVDPVEVVHGVLETVGHLAEQHGVTLECNLSRRLPPIYGNRTLLRQVFLYTLSSMITLPDTQKVCLRMRYERQRVIVDLAAEPGVADRQLDDAAIRRALFLDPVRRLVDMMDGEWQGLEATPGSYTCRIAFPVDRQKVVLVIEDNEAVIRVFRRYLAGYNYQVVGATTGSEALRLAHELSPAAITLDIMMPTQDGWEILQALKNDPATQHIPVIICSVLDDPELARSLGAAAYLHKPVTQADLLSVLTTLSRDSAYRP